MSVQCWLLTGEWLVLAVLSPTCPGRQGRLLRAVSSDRVFDVNARVGLGLNESVSLGLLRIDLPESWRSMVLGRLH